MSKSDDAQKEKKVEECTQEAEHMLTPRNMRALIFHFLYAMESFVYETSLESIIDNVSRGFDLSVDPSNELVKKTQAIIDEREWLDNELEPLLANWRLERLSVITRLILRIALWELKYTDLAPSIIINEAVELAKCFGESDSYRLVNGVLDEWISIHEEPSDQETEDKESVEDNLEQD